MEQNSTMMKGWAVENKTSTLLHEIFAIWWFAYFVTLEFRDFAKILDWGSLQLRVFEQDTINLTFYLIK